jgi:hypothetical protein
MSILMRRALSSGCGDAGRNPRHVGGERVGHEGQRDQHGDKDRDDFWDEYQRGFLDLGQCLKQRDNDADEQSDQHTAVAEAETAVSALVAVRDSVIQSYQEVMRMTI